MTTPIAIPRTTSPKLLSTVTPSAKTIKNASSREAYTQSLRLLVDLTPLHHQLHLSNRRDVLCRITGDRDQVGEIARLHRADAIAPMHHLRIVDRRRSQCLERRESVRDETFDFARVIAVRDRA